MINGRKKYLVPLMLEDIDAGDIKDADLRMYVESHTYLDCKDLVRSRALLHHEESFPL